MNKANFYNFSELSIKRLIQFLLVLGIFLLSNSKAYTQCSCPGNLVQNASFESGTTNWNWSGGTLNSGGGAIKCGSKSGDFQISNGGNNSVYQVIGNGNLLPDGTLQVGVYAGTHDASYYHTVGLSFYTSNWTFISNNLVEVNKVLANSPTGPQFYSINAIIPANTYYVKVIYSGTGNWIKTDGWCVTYTPPVTCDNVTSGGVIGSDESVCANSMDPALIQSVSLPSGGTGTLEYVWLTSTDGGSTYTAIANTNASSYDPGIITQTTWFRRCAKRSGCANYVGESNWVKKELTYCAPSLTCSAGSYSWTQSINTSNGNASIVKLVSGSTNSYTISSGFPSEMTSGPVSLNISQVVSYDGYATRNTVTQTNEKWRLLFKKNGVIIYTSPYTNDVADMVRQASWVGSLGSTFVAPNGIDQIVFEHYDVANGYTGPGSVVPAGICISYQACPTTNAGNPATLTCTNPSATLGIPNVNGNTYSWTPSAGLSVTNIAQPIANPLANTTYTVTVSNASGCTATSTVSVTIDKTPPTADAGTDKNINCTTTSTLIGTTAITGNTYNWSPSTGLSATNIAQPTANPNATTTYTVTVTGSNGCTASDVVVVNVNTSIPTADAGLDKDINCVTTTSTLGSTGIVGNSYSWAPATGLNVTIVPQPVANPSITTTYTVTVTNAASGCTATDVVIVNVNTTVPTANAGADKELNCTSTSTLIGTNAITGNTYSWSPSVGLSAVNIAKPTANPSVTTAYTVTVTNGVSGCTATDVVLVNVNTTVPTANAGTDKNLNCTIFSSTIGATGVAGNSYAWSPVLGLNVANIPQPIASPTTSTTYTVTVTNTASGCTATDVVVVNVNTTLPTADAGVDKFHDCLTTSSVIGTTAISGSTYIWSPATGLNNTNIAQPIASPGTNRIYTVTVTGSNGCTASDMVEVNVNVNTPIANAGGNKSLNCLNTSALIGTNAIAGNSYSWSPSTGLSATNIAKPTASPSATTTYTVTVTGTNGCTATDAVVVNVNTTPPTVDAGMDKNLTCTTTSEIIGTTAIAGNSYSWSPSNGLSSTTNAQPTASPSVTTTYTVTVTGTNGCTATDAVVVNVNTTPPTVDAGMDKNLTCTTTSEIIGTTAIAGNNYSWSPSNGLSSTTNAQPTASPSVTTTYTVTVTGTNGCTATDAVVVNVNTTPPTVDAGMDKNLTCTTTSEIIGTTAIAGNSYSWSPSNGLSSTTNAQPTASPNVTNTYTVTVTGTNGCTATDAVVVNVNTTPPTVDAGMDKNLTCTTTSEIIGTTAIAGNNYSWSPAIGLSSTTNAQPTASPSVTTTYTVTVTGTNGCTATDAVVVNVNTTPPTVDAGMDKNLTCTTTSEIIGTTAIAGNNYSWSPSNGLSSTTNAQPTASPSVTTTYTVTVTGTNGCTAVDVVVVNVNTTPPTVDAGMDKNLTCTTTSEIIGTTAIAGNSYSWSPSNGLSSTTNAQPTASPSVTTTYTVTVTGTNGCTASDEVVVNVNLNPPSVGITGVLHVCNGSTTTLNATGNGSILWSNNSVSSSITVGAGTYSVTITDGVCSSTSSVTVENQQGSIGNYVWNDINTDGLQNEVPSSGINNVVVELWSPGIDNVIGGGDDIMLESTLTANDSLSNPGYYNFVICNTGNYYVKFPTITQRLVLTTPNQGVNIDGNSDAASDGTSAIFTIDVAGTGVAKDNTTIDAGYFALKYIGDKVWFDKDRDGVQDVNEIGVSGITVTLLDNLNRQVASTITDAYGNYFFNLLPGGTYSIAFTLPSGYVFTTKNAGAADEFDSDVNPTTGVTDPFNYQAGIVDLSFDAGIYLPTIQTASVGDKVWNDIDFNGIQDPTETGVAGVTVTLYNESGIAVASTITNTDGIYNFTNVNPGNYYVGFTLPIGYVFSNYGNGSDSLLDSNPNPTNGFTETFTLVAGQNRNDIDAGIHQQQTSNAAIGNYVWNDINNNGVQEINEPGVAGVLVTLYDELGVTPIRTVTTDVLGNYIFNDLPAGNYIVGFSNLPAGFSFVNPLQGANTALDSDPNTQTGKSSVINLLAGQFNTTIDAGVYNSMLATGALGNYVWFDRNNNGIQEVNENGVPGVTVQLYNSSNVYLGKTITNNEGYYIFTGLDAGDYFVNFSALPVNYKLTISNEGNDDTIDSDPNSSTGNSSLVTLGVNETNLTIDAGIVMNSGRNNNGSIGDKVWNDANQNGLQDIEELGVQGVTVTLYQSNGISVLATTTTNSLGEYIFTNLEAGEYIVGFSNLPSGYTYTTPNSGVDDELDSDASLISGGKTDLITLDEGDINLSVDAGIFQNATLASIGDFVWNDLNQNGLQDPNEPGMPGVTVKLYNSLNEVIANTTTDGNGAYQFTGLVPDTYTVEFSNLPLGYLFTTSNANSNTSDGIDSDVDTSTGRTAPIVVTAGTNNYTIDAGLFTLKASLGNYVWEDVNNNGIQDANENGISGITVTLYDQFNNPLTMSITNARGGYSFVNLDPGTYLVGFSNKPIAGTFSPANMGADDAVDSDADQVSGMTATITLVASEYNPTIDAGIHLPTGAGLGDYVWLDLNSDGIQAPNEPGVPGVTVTLYNEFEVALRTTITDQNGAYSFSNLIPGTYKVGFGTLPTYYQPNGKVYQSSFTLNNIGDDAFDNDVNPATGITGNYTVGVGQYISTVDAGIKLDFVLPALELKAFAKLNGSNAVDVSWYTVSEINTSHFEIERSIDAINFTKIADKIASLNTVGTTNYSIDDNLDGVQRKDIIYYRIKMVDQDGKFIYSNTVTVKILETDAEVLVYPSPFNSNLNVLFNTQVATTLNVKINDLNGKTVASKFTEVTQGRNIISFDNLSTLSSGVYMIMITDTENNINTFFKVTKQ